MTTATGDAWHDLGVGSSFAVGMLAGAALVVLLVRALNKPPTKGDQ